MSKIRNGFVSNSSSSSFIIARRDLSQNQLAQLVEIASGPIGEWDDSWYVSEVADGVSGFTIMDNGGKDDGMYKVLQKLDIDMSKVEWNEDH